MKKRKMFYFLVLIVIVSLTITGCSSGGGDSALPGDNNNDSLPGTDGSDSISVSGTITPPQDTSTASGLANGDNNFEVIVSDFDSGKELTTLTPQSDGNGNYKYTITDGIKAGQNLLIEAVDGEITLSTYIPDVGNNSFEESSNVDPESTLVTEIIKKIKKEKDDVKLTPDEVVKYKEDVKNEYGEDLRNKIIFTEELKKVGNSEKDSFINTLENNVSESSEANTGRVASAKEMVNFVRNAGVFLEDSAAKHEVTIKNNVEIVGQTLSDFALEFEAELGPLFISNFANKVPTNAPKGKVYTIEELNSVDDMSNYPTDLSTWKWEIKDGENTIIISTDMVKAIDDSTRTIDFSSAKFNYKINNSTDNYYFDGYIDMDSTRTTSETVTNGYGEEITLVIPEKAEGNIVGEIKTSSLEEPAKININLTQDNQINTDRLVDDVAWNGKFELPGVMTYNGTLSYQGEARIIENTDSNYGEVYYNYLDMQFSGEINTVANETNNNKGLKIVADNLEINTQRRNDQMELDRISLAGYFVDKPKTSLWSGDLTANFVGKVSEALITDFEFTGTVEHVNYADLTIKLNPQLTYDDNDDLEKILSDIKVGRGDKYLEGTVDAAPTSLKVNLTDQDGNVFNMVADDKKTGDVVAEESYIKNSEGKIIANIDSEGLIYYEKDSGDRGEIGSLY